MRHNNFPLIHADWLLDQVIVERERDGAKFKFPCNCWLRRSRPYATISVLPGKKEFLSEKYLFIFVCIKF